MIFFGWVPRLILISPNTIRINSEYSLEGLTLRLQLQYNTLATCCEEPTHWKRPWCWERLRAVEEGGNRGWDGWMVSLLQWTWVWVNSRDSEGQGSLVCWCPWGSQKVRQDLVTKQQQSGLESRIQDPRTPESCRVLMRLHALRHLVWCWVHSKSFSSFPYRSCSKSLIYI